jgi:diamine N-acetyltransferase
MPIDSRPAILREITGDTVNAVIALSVGEGQGRFVAPNSVSLAQALFAPEAWYRAIHWGEELVGFVMLEDQSLRSLRPERPEIGVWRFMIDARFQGRGIGRAAMELIIAHARSRGVFDRLLLSCVPGSDGPEGFYQALGFQHTGDMEDGEVVMEYVLGEGR